MHALAPLFAMLIASPQASPVAKFVPVAISVPAAAALPAARSNDNRTSAGTTRNGVHTLRLVAQWTAWTLQSKRARNLPMLAFAEEGGAPSIPGPVLRVRQGTRVRVVIRSAIPGLTLVVRGLDGHDSDVRDSVVVPSGATVEHEFAASAEGTFYYWGSVTGATVPLRRYGYDGQLNGAFVVDAAAPAPVRSDRIFMISLWSDSSNADGSFSSAREFWAINGKSWPETERLHYTQGDSVRWRIINTSADVHPMHLHGFYYRIDAHGANGRDTLYAPAAQRMAVTEKLTPGTTMQMVWSPNRAGGWVFHCHLTYHLQPIDRIAGQDTASHEHDPALHTEQHMAGLVLGIDVTRAKGRVAAAPSAAARRLRLVVHSDSTIADSAGPRFAAILQDGAHEPARDSMQAMSSRIVLRQGEPTTITLVNQTREPTSIHWHGIELESYYDGVVGVGGMPGMRTPPVMPADSFEVHITAPRAGTFMYHTHFEDVRQQNGGLYGAFTVLAPDATLDAAHDLTFMLANTAIGLVALNGSTAPVAAPLMLQAGQTYRLRIANISTGSPNLQLRLMRDSVAVPWRVVAKDGFNRPAVQVVPRTALQPISNGEIYDFEVTPDRAGTLTIEIRGSRAQLIISQPLHVMP